MDVDGTARIGLYRKDWFSNHSVGTLETTVAKDHCVAFNSVQSAVQACLELLGTRQAETVAIMSILSGPDEMSAVLRAGANPLLLDIEEEYLQMDPDLLKDVLGALSEDNIVPVVLFNKPIGDEINPALMEQVQELPTISVYRGEPNLKMDQEHFCCAFNIIDLTQMVGSGALVLHGFKDQVEHIKLVRSGIMGLAANLAESQANMANFLIELPDTRIKEYNDIKQKYEESDLEVRTTTFPNLIWVKVKDAHLTATQLSSYGIEAKISFFPLHDLDEIKGRFQKEPSYPVADKVKNSYICVPSHHEALERTDEIIKIIGEINE